MSDDPRYPHDHMKDAEAEALEALQSGRLTAGEEPEDEQVAAPDEPVQEATEEAPAPEVEADEDFLPRADLESLLEGLEGDARDRVVTAYKSFQKSATKRNQEVSTLLKNFEGVDPQQAREAYEFVESLKTDRAFASQVHQELAAALEGEGATPAQAQKQAKEIVDDLNPGQLAEWGIDPENPLVAELREMRAFREQMAQQRELDTLERQREQLYRDVQAQDQSLRSKRFDANAPEDEVESEMEAIYRLATAFGGDLDQAAEYFDSLQDSWTTNYVAKKTAAVPKGVEPLPSGSSYSEEPVEINNLKDAHKEALRRIKEGRYNRD